MAVRQFKTVGMCAICKHGKRNEIEAVLERRSLKQVKPEDCLQELRDLGLDNPRFDGNVKSHWGAKKHAYYVADETVEAENTETLELMEKLASGELDFEDIDEGMRFMATVYIRQQKEKFARGEDLHISHDQFLKLVGEMTKRKHNDAQEGLLRAITGGISQGFAGLVAGQVAGELPEVIEGTAVEVEPEGEGE